MDYSHFQVFLLSSTNQAFWDILIFESTKCNKKRAADADKPARRVWRSVKVIKHGTIP